MGKTKNRKENNATKVTKLPKNEGQKYGMNETLATITTKTVEANAHAYLYLINFLVYLVCAACLVNVLLYTYLR